MRGSRILTDEQIKEAKELRESGYTKKRLAVLYEVSETTIWEHVFAKEIRKRDRRKYFKFFRKKERICIPCSVCEICLTKEVENKIPPVNYQIGDKCLICYLKDRNIKYLDLLGRLNII